MSKRLCTALLTLLTAVSLWAGQPTFLVDYSDRIEEAHLRTFDYVIAGAEAELALKPADVPCTVLGYLSLCEIGPGVSWFEDAKRAGVQILGENKTWNSKLVSPADPAWRRFFLETLAPALDAHGYEGFFLDTAESLELLIAKEPEREAELKAAMASLIAELKQRFPKHYLMVNRGFSSMEQWADAADGLLCESLYLTYNYAKKTYGQTSEDDQQWLLERLKKAKGLQLDVFILDFAPRGALAAAREAAARMEADGFSALITPAELEGPSLAPLREMPRQIHVCYGNNQYLDAWAEDTDTRVCYQTAAEWLGFEFSYHNPALETVAPRLTGSLAAVVIDASLRVPIERQAAFVDWVLEVQRRQIPILLLGGVPKLEPQQLDRLSGSLGLLGTFQSTAKPTDPVQIRKQEAGLFEYEAMPDLRTITMVDLQAPLQAEALLQLESGSLRYDPVFLAPWGAAIFDPYLQVISAEEDPMLAIDPFAFWRRLLLPQAMPVPDVSTRLGRRLFFSHIDGDGFLNKSLPGRGAYSGPIILDKVIERFGLPVTCSIIEAEIAGLVPVYQPKPGEDFVAEARRLFAHPLVETSSHTFTHPFYWSALDVNTTWKYKTQRPPLIDSFDYPEIDYEREVHGSLHYINTLLAPEKPGRLLLWSGNCRPPPECLRIVREHGYLNMNGGGATITNRAPYLSLIPGKCLEWGGELQVYTAQQNENVFNNALKNDTFGGFVNVIQTMELTEKPRRLKPVNVYYHFYSADRFDSYTALNRVLQWCISQKLHPIFATDYVENVHASRKAGVYQKPDGSWLLAAGPKQRSWRIDAQMGYPNATFERGLWGYTEANASRFLHTDGRALSELTLVDKPAAGPYLAESTVDVQFLERSDRRWKLALSSDATVKAELILRGLAPGQAVQAAIGGKNLDVRADAKGQLTVLCEPQGSLTLTLAP